MACLGHQQGFDNLRPVCHEASKSSEYSARWYLSNLIPRLVEPVMYCLHMHVIYAMTKREGHMMLTYPRA